MRNPRTTLHGSLVAAVACVAVFAATPSRAQTCAPVPTGLVAWWPGDSSANDIAGGNHGTLQNGAAYAAGLVGQAFNLDGVNDYVSFLSRPVAQQIPAEFTLEWWANPGSTADRPSWGFLASGTNNMFNPIASYDSGLSIGNGSNNQLMTALPNAGANAWTHYAVVDDGTRYRVYVNGAESHNALITISPASGSSRTFAIGQSGFVAGYEQYFRGLLDEFTVYSRGLSASEIAGIHAAGATGKCNACGNGATQSGEQCDDGNAVNGDGCDNNCTLTACGNFIATAGEQCDDGNLAAGDCCSASCQFESAGSSCASDANSCTDDACDGSGLCLHSDSTGPCNDGVFCNGLDTCASGTCSVHAGDTCSGADGDGDCSETCNEATDDCSAPDANGTACDDGLFCTGDDICSAGNCSGDADNPCEGGADCMNACNETSNDCSNPSGSACTDDGNACTDDQCDGAGSCVHPVNSAPCSDGVFCNGADSCGGGTCSVHAGDPCSGGSECALTCNEAIDLCATVAGTPCTDDGNTCTSDECNGSGGCGHPGNTAPCDDGVFCNGSDTCSGGSCSSHTGDPCPPGVECVDGCNEAADNCAFPTGNACTDDGNPCTNDLCDGVGGCVHPANSAPCNDGLYCNGVDTCSGGSCAIHSGDPCTSGQVCANVCNEGADSCILASGVPCTDDSNVCTDDQCNGFGFCVHLANSAPCDDELFCNGADSCAASACTVHTGDPCPAPGECVVPCDEVLNICFDAAATPCTDDSNSCTNDVCDGAGTCDHAPVGSGTVCRSDAGQCDVAETCDGAGSPCPADSLEPDGTACSDGAACTIADQCIAGACSGNSMTCGDATVQSGCNEECDDGGFVADDGCDASCQLEPCKAAPDNTCNPPFVSEKASIKLKDDDDNSRDALQWKWSNGTETMLADFGSPTTTDDYWLCIYDNGELVSTTRVPAGGDCDDKPCWAAKTKGFQFKSKTPTVNGATGLSMAAGEDGKAKAQMRAKGANLEMPNLTTIGGPVVVQLVNAGNGRCWTATYSPPFSKYDEENLGDKAD